METERERIKRAQGHVDLDGRHVGEAEERLKQAAQSRTIEFVEKRRQLAC